eukprot:CAMPEP_0202857906 /NCGR_PEP_ID=MMETSP1391-20130828/666_1 /ASSEMBLY_ACC=CAM_ASM_000867 /TAXON_ID=1034604 /ORGANISM="Chlamydomonas leiostraca, Strain SAG 11-49" /LENGTH=328 /DNA_ID=CAMNT_0049536769 /DNA_START=189 /DNA_END=1176 /DNA_ORIENTATION=+
MAKHSSTGRTGTDQRAIWKKAWQAWDPAKDKEIVVTLVRPVRFDAPRLAAFHRLACYPSTSGSTPLMYPICQAFRLNIQAMLLPAFPYPVLGSVLARHTTVMTRAVGAEEALVYSARVEPVQRTTPKGDIEVDLVTEAWAVPAGSKCGAGGPGGAPVWRSTLTVIILTRKTGQRSAGAAPAPAQPSTWSLIDKWTVGGDVGRRYGALNGDLNPIHLSAVTSRLFGFKRPIAHALFLMARAEASLRSAGVSPVFPARFEASFKRPTLLPARLQCVWQPEDQQSGGASPSLAQAAKAGLVAGGPGLVWGLLTEDGAKEVMVGKLSVAEGM